MPWYRTGTVSVTLNSNAVVGTGTAFVANSRVGDAFLGPDGGWYEITNIASNTALSITPNYRGASNATGVYALTPVQGYTKDLADQARAMIQQWGAIAAGLGSVSTENVVPVAKGGTGGTTAALGRVGLELKSASIVDLVGIITQVGGVAGGAVFQSGSNANGDFIRFANGWQICILNTTATVAVTLGPASGLYYGSASWTYPAAFSSAPIPICSANSGGVLTINLSPTTTLTSAAPGIGSIASIPSRSYSLALFAVGRWY